MRKPERLDNFYAKLAELHKKYVPDWRFGQMIYNYLREMPDPFYLEEDKMLEKLEEYLKENIGL